MSVISKNVICDLNQLVSHHYNCDIIFCVVKLLPYSINSSTIIQFYYQYITNYEPPTRSQLPTTTQKILFHCLNPTSSELTQISNTWALSVKNHQVQRRKPRNLGRKITKKFINSNFHRRKRVFLNQLQTQCNTFF